MSTFTLIGRNAIGAPRPTKRLRAIANEASGIRTPPTVTPRIAITGRSLPARTEEG